jgi:hypothetical protein
MPNPPEYYKHEYFILEITARVVTDSGTGIVMYGSILAD